MDQDDELPPLVEEDRLKLDELFCNRYDRIRALAAQVSYRGSNPTLNPTALAHEAYLKLLNRPPDCVGKSYEDIVSVFANAMRQILADAARRKRAQKRTAAQAERGNQTLPVEDALTVSAAMEQLGARDPRKVNIANCRFLLGMTVHETASALRLSPRTVEREWESTKRLLGQVIQPASE